MKHQYNVDIRWSDEDQVFVARVPELSGVVTHGNTSVEAAKMAEDAIELHLESMKKLKMAVPAPVATRKLSPNVLVRMPDELRQDAQVRTDRLDLSLNEYVVNLIRYDIERSMGISEHKNIFERISDNVDVPLSKLDARLLEYKRKNIARTSDRYQSMKFSAGKKKTKQQSVFKKNSR